MDYTRQSLPGVNDGASPGDGAAPAPAGAAASPAGTDPSGGAAGVVQEGGGQAAHLLPQPEEAAADAPRAPVAVNPNPEPCTLNPLPWTLDLEP